MNRRDLLIALTVTATGGGLMSFPVQASKRKSLEYIVEIDATSFLPAFLVLNPGDRVVWVNRDNVPHAVSARNGSWVTDELAPNAWASVVITRSRTGNYYCRLQPHLEGMLKLIG